MKTIHVVTTVVLAFSAAVCLRAGEQAIPQQIESVYMTFKHTKDPDLLSKAIALIERQPANGVDDMIQLRVAFLKKIESEYDPTYDSSPPAPVQAHVMPPEGYDTGVSPQAVADPVARADYEKRIAENAENARRHKIQTAIRHLINRTAMLTLRSMNNDLKEVRNTFESMGLPKELVEALDAEAGKEKEKANKAMQPTR